MRSACSIDGYLECLNFKKSSQEKENRQFSTKPYLFLPTSLVSEKNCSV